jgi:hypothetical protein
MMDRAEAYARMPRPSLEPERLRAESLGIVIRVNVADDRPRADGGPTWNGCPECRDGILTVTHPTRCRECSIAWRNR